MIFSTSIIVNKSILTMSDNAIKYYSNIRPALLQMIGENAGHVLDVGCGEGVLGEYLLAQGCAKSVIGVEYNVTAATLAHDKLTQVFCGDVEQLTKQPSELNKHVFDSIVCGDVLEHLRDPWEAVRCLNTLLAPDGKLIVSVPNVRHWRVVLPLLLRGAWEYQAQGILDRTHLRFFTRTTAIALLDSPDLTLESCRPLCYRRIDRMLSKLSFGLLDGLLATQWLMVAKRVD